ncbi:hypothetical protein BDB00DRAFT_755002 [Zychaea mexicana]|uniref:uncharacterized protein n=1 Tax=Zychaea mexicana TaxID=64656 RepID=UPI0022FF3E04|nr:uncharacterized protein BDB00DRAFT_755002 [Zychaea mexicana]KAI9498300.1 hypothetical protein BDB00DRAFT_755002 [Zychaea mexicana]
MREDRDRKVLNALETYFSDANLTFDKLLKQYIQKDPNGFVPIDTIVSLKRLKEIQTKPEEIVNASQKSTHLQLNDNKTAVARIKPFVASKDMELDDWSIYVEGLWKPYDTQEKIAQLFTRLVGNVSFVRFPPDLSKRHIFHGFCFIEFSEKEDVTKAIEQIDCSRGQKHQDPEITKLCLKVISKHEYNQFKDQYLERLVTTRKAVKRAWAEYNGEHVDGYPEGLVAFVTNLAPKSSKTVITNLLAQAGVEVAYVDYKKNSPSCHVRLKASADTDKLVKYFNENKKIQKDGKDSVGTSASAAEASQALGVRKLTGKCGGTHSV